MGKYDVKQLIIVRKDLGMNKGKLAAQASHASMGALLKSSYRSTVASGNPDRDSDEVLIINLIDNLTVKEWLGGSFAKVVLAVNSEEELEKCRQIAIDNELRHAYIVDDGTTVFNGVKTPTCIGIGPAKSETLDALFGALKLY